MIKTNLKTAGRSLLFAGAAGFTLLVVAVLYFHSVAAKPLREEPFDVVKAYLKAGYARDYAKAYQYISSQDQRVWDEKSYSLQNASLNGFALELAQKLAESMQIWVIDQQRSSDRARYTIGYQVPTADELSSLLFNWDPDKLNTLARPRQKELLETLEKLKKDGKMITIKGQETFELIADEGGWKIFYDWASDTKVEFKMSLPPSSGIDIHLLNSQFLVKKDEPFQITLKVRNHGKEAVVARIIHHVEPRDMENHIDLIACGALQPIVLRPGDEQEISSAYMIKSGIRAGMKIAITYEFHLEPLPSNIRAYPKTSAASPSPQDVPTAA
jgi:hypothetical protein